jgi:hypothetical protein
MNALTLAQPDHPGLTLALPPHGLTQAALGTADVVVGLPSFGGIATQTTFGPSCVRLQASGLDRGTAHAAVQTATSQLYEK